jgi:hypothetical protein
MLIFIESRLKNELKIKSENWSYGLKSTKSQALWEDVKWKVHIYARSSWRRFFYLILSIGMPLYQEGYYMDCQ